MEWRLQEDLNSSFDSSVYGAALIRDGRFDDLCTGYTRDPLAVLSLCWPGGGTGGGSDSCGEHVGLREIARSRLRSGDDCGLAHRIYCIAAICLSSFATTGFGRGA